MTGRRMTRSITLVLLTAGLGCGRAVPPLEQQDRDRNGVPDCQEDKDKNGVPDCREYARLTPTPYPPLARSSRVGGYGPSVWVWGGGGGGGGTTAARPVGGASSLRPSTPTPSSGVRSGGFGSSFRATGG